MTDNNTLRRLNWLWKHRHTHDDDNFQEQITIINTIVENLEGGQNQSGVGAHVFVSASSQSLDGVEAVEWDGFSNVLEFSPSFPSTDLVINKPGYYWVRVELAWDTFEGGGMVQLVRDRGGITTTPYPLSTPGEWVSSSGKRFVDSAGGLEFEAGDILRLVLGHEESGDVDLEYALMQVALQDRIPGAVPPPEGPEGLTDEAYSQRDDETSDELTVTMTTAQESGDAMFMMLANWTAGFDTYPSGWTVLIDDYNIGGGAAWWALLWKISDGTETDVVVTATDNTKMVGGVWVVSSDVDYSADPPTLSSVVQPPDTPFPPQPVSPGAGSYLVFHLVGRNGGGQTPNGWSPGYTYSSVIRSDSGSSELSDHGAGIEVFHAPIEIESDPYQAGGLIGYEFWWLARHATATLAVPI